MSRRDTTRIRSFDIQYHDGHVDRSGGACVLRIEHERLRLQFCIACVLFSVVLWSQSHLDFIVIKASHAELN